MQAFVWRRVDNVSDHWHNEGGVLVVAESLEAARDAIRAEALRPGCGPDYECGALTKAPDLVLDVVNAEPTLIVFPDAGCC